MTSPAGKPQWQEGVGGLLLLVAANATALLSQLEEVLPMKQQNASVSLPSAPRLFYSQRSLLLTLLFLPVVGLRRFWDLRSYTGRELALLTGRARPYSYRHTERFLLRLVSAQADQALTKALARWTTTLWQVETRSQEASPPHFYIDGLSLAVYTNTLIPRGLIGNSGKILGCRTLVLLHDDQGHPLLATTHRGDLHLTNGIPQVLTCYEQATEALHLARLVVDREAMAADAPFTTEHRGSHHDYHPQDKPIERTRLLYQRWFVCPSHSGPSWHSATSGRSCSVSLGSCLFATRTPSDSRWR